MYSDNLDYLPKPNVGSPLVYRKSPVKYIPNEQKYSQAYNVNKSLGYPSTEDWSSSDFQSLRKVGDDVGSLRQTLDGRSNSKVQQILSKYEYDNEDVLKTPVKSDLSLRQSYNPRSRPIQNFRTSSFNIPETMNGYTNNVERVRSPPRNQKLQFDISKYKQQLEELEATKKMAEQLRKLKEDRRKRISGGIKEVILQSSYKQEQEIPDFKRNKETKYEQFYSPKYEKIDIAQNLQASKTMPLKKLNLDKYKTKSEDKPQNYLLNNVEQQQNLYKSKSVMDDSPEIFLSPTRIPNSGSNTASGHTNGTYTTGNGGQANGAQTNSSSNSKQVYSPTKLSNNFKPPRKASSNVSLFSTSNLIDEFIIGKFLGEGRFGSVYQVLHKPTGAIFAMKKIPKQNVKKLNMVNQLILQLKIQTFLHHQNIVTLYHSFDDTTYIYLLLEYMQQGPLFSLLKKKKTLAQADVSQKMKQIASAIKYMQDNEIAHRDIKPQNIVMTHGVCKICDFGWATLCQNRRRTCCGTLDYTPPEIFQGAEYDQTVDLWCLGVLAYELLVGKAPFYHIRRQETKNRILNVQKTSINYPSQLSKKSISFIQSLIKKDPKERLSSEALLLHPFLQTPEEDL